MVLGFMFVGFSLLEVLSLVLAAEGVTPPLATPLTLESHSHSFASMSFNSIVRPLDGSNNNDMLPDIITASTTPMGWTSSAKFTLTFLLLRAFFYLAACYSFHSLRFPTQERLAAEREL